ncbi:MAG: hypothetical protein ACD_79C00496G0005 [uncultured bacterium]|nr:MAG: hypothetical protein ACD_79C00496G0005 [uncultured bacterium]
MKQNIMYFFTRTPLHIGAGSSVGSIDMPVIRERHTRFPVIPATSIKGVLSDFFIEQIKSSDDKQNFKRTVLGNWLFGNEDAKDSNAGALLFGEGKILLFPVRSGRNSFAFVTSPLVLKRFWRDTEISPVQFKEPNTDECLTPEEMTLDGKVILEEYCLNNINNNSDLENLINSLEGKIQNIDELLKNIKNRIVIVSDEMMSYFAEHACEVVTRIKIDDFTGTAEGQGLFNQENVPSESLFYSVVHSRNGLGQNNIGQTEEKASGELKKLINENKMIQIGGDASTGHGWCSISLSESEAK